MLIVLLVLFNVVVLSKVMPPAAGAPHFKPVAVELSAMRTVSLAPTAKRATVSAAVAAIMSPLASTIVLAIPAAALLNTVVSIEEPSVRMAAAPSLTRSVSLCVVHP